MPASKLCMLCENLWWLPVGTSAPALVLTTGTGPQQALSCCSDSSVQVHCSQLAHGCAAGLCPAHVQYDIHCAVQTIGDSQFAHNKLNIWTNNIVEGCLKKLAALGKPFKYVVTCNLVQKAGAGLHAASSSRWQDKTDGKMPVQWENKTLFVLTTVFWVAI